MGFHTYTEASYTGNPTICNRCGNRAIVETIRLNIPIKRWCKTHKSSTRHLYYKMCLKCEKEQSMCECV